MTYVAGESLSSTDFQLFMTSARQTLLADADIEERLAELALGATEATPRARANKALEHLIQDARTTLLLIEGWAQPGQRLLEIGGGVGLAAIWLQRRGFDVISLEPSNAGHGNYHEIGLRIMQRLGGDTSRWLGIAANEVSQLGARFDLIFSNNVLEHMADLDGAIVAMRDVLAQDGIMRHNCPNYGFPYEPHFCIPLLPFFPRAAALWHPRLRRDELWRGLNFVSARQMVRLAKRHALGIRFDRDHLHRTFLRLEGEPLFRAKHYVLAGTFRALRALRLANLLRFVPPTLVTPMQFTLSRRRD